MVADFQVAENSLLKNSGKSVECDRFEKSSNRQKLFTIKLSFDSEVNMRGKYIDR